MKNYERGRAEFKNKKPTPFNELRKLTNSTALPEIAKNRYCTDVGYIIFFGLAFLLLVILSGVFAVDTDYKRFVHGIDSCGNLCGLKNEKILDAECSGLDNTGKDIVFYHRRHGPIRSECIEACPSPNALFFGRCSPPKLNYEGRLSYELLDTLHRFIPAIIVMSFVALILCYVLIMCFIIKTVVTLWFLLIADVVMIFGSICFCWYSFVSDDDKGDLNYQYIIPGMLFIFMFIFLLSYMILVLQRFDLLIRMFKEAMKPLLKVKCILIQPLISLLFLLIMTITVTFLIIIMGTRGTLQQKPDDVNSYEYTSNLSLLGFVIYAAIILIWVYSFTNACQVLIISGAVAAWYFSKDKDHLEKPYFNSFCISLRYHLGTAAFGSLIVTVIGILRLYLKIEHENQKGCLAVLTLILMCCLTCIEEIVQYITRKAYIQTAVHGTPLYESGKRGARLLWNAKLDTYMVDGIGYAAIHTGGLLILIITCTVGFFMNYHKGVNYILFGVMVGGGAAGTIVYFFTQCLNVTIETIFLCYCEDHFLMESVKAETVTPLEFESLIQDFRDFKANRRAKREERRQERQNLTEHHAENV